MDGVLDGMVGSALVPGRGEKLGPLFWASRWAAQVRYVEVETYPDRPVRMSCTMWNLALRYAARAAVPAVSGTVGR